MGISWDLENLLVCIKENEPMKSPAYIAAIGSSAGGLRPMQAFFSQLLPDNTSYVIVRHIGDEAKSHLREILQKNSYLEVTEAEDNMPVEKNKVYILPAGSYMTIRNGRLHLQKRNGGHNCAIDIFLHSLAGEYKHKAIAVVLSGSGRNGVKGVGDVKAAGGMVIVQQPSSAEFPSMPQHAIQTGHADQILLPDKMPAAIRHFTH